MYVALSLQPPARLTPVVVSNQRQVSALCVTSNRANIQNCLHCIGLFWLLQFKATALLGNIRKMHEPQHGTNTVEQHFDEPAARSSKSDSTTSSRVWLKLLGDTGNCSLIMVKPINGKKGTEDNISSAIPRCRQLWIHNTLIVWSDQRGGRVKREALRLVDSLEELFYSSEHPFDSLA